MELKATKRRLINGGLVLLAIGPALLGIGTAKEQISRLIMMPGLVVQISLIAGVALTIVGLLTFAGASLVPEARSDPREDKHLCLFAGKSELRELHAIYTEYFGREVLSLDAMQLITQRYRRAFAVIYLVEEDSLKKKQRLLAGSFKVLRLTGEAVQGLEARQLTGSTLEPHHIATRQRDTKALYVGDVFATTPSARGMVIKFIMRECEVAIRNRLPIYARPLTPSYSPSELP